MKDVLEKQTAILQKVEKLLAMDRLIQLSQAALQLKTDKDLNKDEQLNLDKLDGIAKTLKAMNKTLSKSELHLAKQVSNAVLDKSSKFKRATTLKDIAQEKISNVKDFFTVRGFLDKTGIAERGGSGILSRLADAREIQKEFVQQQLLVTGKTFDKGTKEEKNRAKAATKQFKESQRVLKKIDNNEAQIQKLKDAGWSESQIKDSGLYKERDKLTTALRVDKRAEAAAKEEAANLKKSSTDKISKEVTTEKVKKLKQSNKLMKASGETEAKIERLKASGWSDAKIAKTGLLERRDSISTSLKKVDNKDDSKQVTAESVKASKESVSNEYTPTVKSAKAAPAVSSSEADVEVQRLRERQVDLLEKIEENTAALKPTTAKEKEGNSTGSSGGGLLGGMATGVGLLGGALAKFGRGVGRGLQSILFGLARGFAALANPLTLVGMGAFTLAAIGIGKALQLAAPAIEAFVPMIVAVADTIKTVFVEGIKAIPDVIKSIGDVIIGIVKTISDSITGVIDTVVGSVERLGKVDGAGLFQVAAGLVAIGAGLAAFAAGNVATGLTNFVGGLFNAITGQKSPIEQLEAIAKLGPGLQQAGDGLQKVSSGLASFNKPGSNTGNIVTGMTNKMNDAKDAAASKQSAPVIVSAPTNVSNTSKQNIAMPQPVRNTDSGFASYLKSKMSFV